MDAAALLRCHEAFVGWCQVKESVLAIAEHLFPPKHALYQAVVRALVGDPLSACRLVADNSACCLCDALGEETFARVSGDHACVDLFYGASLRALVAGGEATPRHRQAGHGIATRHSEALTLDERAIFTELSRLGHAFATSARTLTTAPRLQRKMDACEARFLSAWSKVQLALRGVRVDTRPLVVAGMALRRCGLPSGVSALVLSLLVELPEMSVFMDAPHGKRRRLA